jgi:hypothetical protein
MLGPAEKIERLFDMSLDDLFEIMSWPRAELDPPRVSLQVQVMRIVVKIAGKAVFDGCLDREITRGRERDAVLARMVSEFSKTS